jgi:L-glyceraldehyde 3-phosphate reductase
MNETYSPDKNRYDAMQYRRCGTSGLKLPAISLGCWHNFGAAGTASNQLKDEDDFHENCRQMLFTAFDGGINHFDLANNYGPPPGAAEERVGRILREDFGGLRDELIISSKAGYGMWPGPYGDGGSRKYLLASLDQSLQRLGLDYVDIFYHHRPDSETPLEESMSALDTAVRSGKALYAGFRATADSAHAMQLKSAKSTGSSSPSYISQVTACSIAALKTGCCRPRAPKVWASSRFARCNKGF